MDLKVKTKNKTIKVKTKKRQLGVQPSPFLPRRSGTVNLIERDGRFFIHPRKLTANPLNAEIYDLEQDNETVNRLVDDFERKIKLGECPNEQPITIWSNGLIDAGHTRTRAGLIADCELWVMYTDKIYPDIDLKPFTSLQSVRSSNIYRKMTHSVKLNEFEQMNKAYVLEHGLTRSPQDEEVHLKELGTSRATMKKLIEIKETDPSLLPLVDSSEMSVKAAWEEATGRNKPKVVKSNNPNRDWSVIYTTDIFRTTLNRVNNTIHTLLNQSCKINGDDFYPFKDFTKGAIAANISHLLESIGAEVLRSEGHNVRCATGHPTDPDIYHIDEDDKVEIKVTNFDRVGTKWKGGMGIREGQYILVTYDESIGRYCVIFTPLVEKDWKSAGIGGHTLPIKNVYDNHKDEMVVIYGDVYESNGKVVLQLDTI